MRLLLALPLFAAAVPARSDVVGIPDPRDPRIATLHFKAANAFRVNVQAGADVTLILPPGEIVTGVDVSAPADWQVVRHGNGQSVVIQPNRPVPDATMRVTSSVRDYRFVLSSKPAENAPLVLRIVGVPRDEHGAPSSTGFSLSEGMVWILSGNNQLKPSAIRDDGAKTYLEWPASQPIPAIFAVDRLGREEMVNGFMRGQTFVIDRVFEHLLFRIDQAQAQARRQPARRRS